eukprot:c4426_g1_i1.p1 GENE.c4426_g1_i1~~c4426_g1_i1.p1  ORF type:complete len:347 (+),score=45.57 c4426_g1_i1:29-1042(+)
MTTRQPWDSKEDIALARAVDQAGTKNWPEVARLVANRSAKQCRERWKNHLDPSIRRGRWSKKEDKKIMSFVTNHGQKWSVLAKLLPGRSDASIKNRFHGSLKRRFDPEFDVIRDQSDRSADLSMSDDEDFEEDLIPVKPKKKEVKKAIVMSVSSPTVTVQQASALVIDDHTVTVAPLSLPSSSEAISPLTSKPSQQRGISPSTHVPNTHISKLLECSQKISTKAIAIPAIATKGQEEKEVPRPAVRESNLFGLQHLLCESQPSVPAIPPQIQAYNLPPVSEILHNSTFRASQQAQDRALPRLQALSQSTRSELNEPLPPISLLFSHISRNSIPIKFV